MSAKWSTPAYAKYLDSYYDKVWFEVSMNINSDLCILTRRDGSGYWVSLKADRDGAMDIGPFDSFEAAAAAYETMQ